MAVDFIPSPQTRLIAEWEHNVRFNLSESAVHPLRMQEFLSPEQLQDLAMTELAYPQTNGVPILRERIAAMYPGASPDNVVVTTGAAQANFNSIMTLLNPGDEILMPQPSYRQAWALAQNFGYKVRFLRLNSETGWRIDPMELKREVGPSTRLIVICNPNNPTGLILSEEETSALIEQAQRVGAWLLVDEVCAGMELAEDAATPTLWGRYDRLIVTNSMSKAYGLPGLRIGWVVAPREVAEQVWHRIDLMTISTTLLSNLLAAHALAPETRPRLLARGRRRIREGYARINSWLEQHPGMFSHVPPQASAVAFVRYDHPLGSEELVRRLIREKGTLMVPGAFLGAENHLRISFDIPEAVLYGGLDGLYALLKELPA